MLTWLGGGNSSMPLEDFQLLVAQARSEATNSSYRVSKANTSCFKSKVIWLTEGRRSNCRPTSLCKSKSNDFGEPGGWDNGDLPRTTADMSSLDGSRTNNGVTRAAAALCNWQLKRRCRACLEGLKADCLNRGQTELSWEGFQS
jgi:hypothetical protein